MNAEDKSSSAQLGKKEGKSGTPWNSLLTNSLVGFVLNKKKLLVPAQHPLWLLEKIMLNKISIGWTVAVIQLNMVFLHCRVHQLKNALVETV